MFKMLSLSMINVKVYFAVIGKKTIESLWINSSDCRVKSLGDHLSYFLAL